MSELRAIDPTRCWLRHNVRGQEGDTGAHLIAGAWFVPKGVEGINGDAGWQVATPTCVLEDDGTCTVAFVNGVGGDGVMHNARFSIFDEDGKYEPGEEWVEVWTDADVNKPLFVGTPTDGELTTSTVTLSLTDLGTVLAGSLSSEVDYWDSKAPADALLHYSRLKVLALGEELPAVEPEWVPSPGNAFGVAVDATHVYWGEVGFIGRANIDGSEVEPKWLNVGGGAPLAITVDAGHIYWSQGGSAIGRATLAGGSIVLEWIKTGEFSPVALAVDAGHIYWGIGFKDGVGRATIAGGTVENEWIKSSGESNGGRGIAVNSEHVYWATADGQAIGRATLAGGELKRFLILTTRHNLHGIALDAEHVYWGDSEGLIGRAKLAGEDINPGFVARLRHPNGIALDANHLYWAEGTGEAKERFIGRSVNLEGGPAIGGSGGRYVKPLVGIQYDSWSAEATVRLASVVGFGEFKFSVGLAPFNGARIELWIVPAVGGGAFVRLFPPPGSGGEIGGRCQVPVSEGVATYSLRLVAHHDHIFAFVNGELVADFRRNPELMEQAAEKPPDGLELTQVASTSVEVLRLQVDTLAPFAGTEGLVDRFLPGAPPPGGLHSQWWGYDAMFSQNKSSQDRLARLWSALGDPTPTVDRIDAQVNYKVGDPAPVPGGFAARWSGAIYLDLANVAELLKVHANGEARVFIGKTMVGDEYMPGNWGVHLVEEGARDLASVTGLREWLGEVSGWYPIVIEQMYNEGIAGLQLEKYDYAAANYFPVQSSLLSPLGVQDGLIRYTPHRQAFAEICATFGYQWRAEYRSLESGSAPGQWSARVLQGRQTNKRITEDDTVGALAVKVVASDVVDGIIADAAGIADPRGNGQISAEEVALGRASDHMALRQLYESLADITELPLLRGRLASLLALKAAPNEQVGVQPNMQRDLTDTFPLTGDMVKFNWEPGDGALLAFEKLRVKDRSPRQMTSIAWKVVPDAIAGATVGFRARARSPKTAIKRLSNAIYAPRRIYQGGRAVSNASLGAAGFGAVASADAYSRIGVEGRRIVQVELVVFALVGEKWELQCSPAALKPGIKVERVGRYDITSSIRPDPGGYLWATLVNGVGGGNGFMCHLELTLTV